MLLQRKEWKRTLKSGLRLVLGLALAGFAAVPVSAQLDPGERWALVTGHWSREARDTVAWVELDGWKLVTRVDHPVVFDPDPNPWRPVAGDWDGTGIETVKMFDPRSWKLVSLAEGRGGDPRDPDPNPWIPVAGDWDGRGIDTVLVVNPIDRSVHRIEEGPQGTHTDDPSPNPWRPVIGDWLRQGRDAISWVQGDGAVGAWTPVGGNWSGSGVSALAAIHHATGQLVQAGLAARAKAATPKGCSVSIKNRVRFTQEIAGPDGSVIGSRFGFHEEWTCCPLSAGEGQYGCTEALVTE